MGLCIDLGYEVVSVSQTLSSGTGVNTYTVTAPTGKVPVGASVNFAPSSWTSTIDYRRLVASYPGTGGDWVFKIQADGTINYGVTLHVAYVNS